MVAEHLSVEDRVRRAALEECRLDMARPVVVGFSGGADSLTLLGTLKSLGIRVIAAHFDHHLREDSGDDARRAKALADALGVAYTLGEGQVKAFARAENLSLEAAARELRYHFLFEQARAAEAQVVAVGHTADDQVETFLLHLLRGSGLAGLRGMAYCGTNPAFDTKIPIIRPLLGVWRAETEAWCREHDMAPVEDPTNRETAFLRNRVRLELLPQLETYNPEVKRALWRSALTLAGDYAALETLVDQAWSRARLEGGEGWTSFDLAAFTDLDPALQRGVLRRGWPGRGAAESDSLRDLELGTIERARGLLFDPPRSGAAELAGGVWLHVEGDRFYLRRQTAALPSDFWPQLNVGQVLAITAPGTIDLPGGWRLLAEVCDDIDTNPGFSANVGDDPFEAWLDADAVPFPLEVRAIHPGERWQPLGMTTGTLKISDFYTNAKLPRRARARWPVVATAGQVIWVSGLRPAELGRLTAETRRALHLKLYREPEPGRS